MDSTTIWAVVLVIAALGVLALVLTSLLRRERGDQEDLRRRFGPEYDRVLEEHGDDERARRVLRRRAKRVAKLRIRDLDGPARARFSRRWSEAQAKFVDDPEGAVTDSHRLVEEVMRARGYPVDSFEQEIEDLSVHHANVVQHYRAARALERGVREGRASTEDLRQSMVHYRALFSNLLSAPVGEPPSGGSKRERRRDDREEQVWA